MFFLLATFAAWTNTARQVVWAEPVRIGPTSVVLNCRAGGRRELPLTVFPESERRRLKAALGEYELPVRLRELRAVLAADLVRAEQRHTGGVLTDEKFAAKRARVNAAWLAALGRAQLAPAEVEYWKGRLR
ncbi:MAG: hypothetical protein ACI4RD_01395 [Kiritimatiellia bacterium]